MAKGQKRSNKEIRKPKADKAKAAGAAAAAAMPGKPVSGAARKEKA